MCHLHLLNENYLMIKISNIDLLYMYTFNEETWLMSFSLGLERTPFKLADQIIYINVYDCKLVINVFALFLFNYSFYVYIFLNSFYHG